MTGEPASAPGEEPGSAAAGGRSQPRGPQLERSTEPREGYTAVGRVLRPHGLRGELRVEAFAAGAPNLQPGVQVYLAGERRRILKSREDRGAWLVQLQGLADRTSVEGFRGALLEVRDRDVRRLDADSYFIHELIGLRVVTSTGDELGRITEVLQPGGNDVYVVRGERGEVLVPAIAQVIDTIDVAGGVAVITPLPGLLDEAQ